MHLLSQGHLLSADLSELFGKRASTDDLVFLGGTPVFLGAALVLLWQYHTREPEKQPDFNTSGTAGGQKPKIQPGAKYLKNSRGP